MFIRTLQLRVWTGSLGTSAFRFTRLFSTKQNHGLLPPWKEPPASSLGKTTNRASVCRNTLFPAGI